MADSVWITMNVSGDAAKLKKFVEEQKGRNRPTDDTKLPEIKDLQFNNLIPYPHDPLRREIYDGEEYKFTEYHLFGYQWEKDNWGCKWGAMNIELDYNYKTEAAYHFETANVFPDKWFKVLYTKYNELDFYIEFEGPNREVAGTMEIKRGVLSGTDIAVGEEEVLARMKLNDPVYYDQIMADRQEDNNE